jgi:hypothetical protein
MSIERNTKNIYSPIPKYSFPRGLQVGRVDYNTVDNKLPPGEKFACALLGLKFAVPILFKELS